MRSRTSARPRSTPARRASRRSSAWRCSRTTRAPGSRPRTAASSCACFGYRLALTLPLLVIAGWLFAKKRKSTWWPFVWGFIYFALFAFFVELVPYLPSYGGYVRYAVGIVVTVLVGRYAIVALNRYLARQKLAEAQPETVRRNELSYDTALARLAKSVCPGCERPVDLKNTEIDFCPHCGIGLFDHCRACKARKSAFARFCHACGTAAASAAPAGLRDAGSGPAGVHHVVLRGAHLRIVGGEEERHGGDVLGHHAARQALGGVDLGRRIRA